MTEYRKLIERTEQLQNDIALIKLDQPVRNLPFVPIATQVTNLVGQAATVYGFGISEIFDPNVDEPHTSPIMLRGETTIVDKNTCAQEWGLEIRDQQYVCTIGTQDSCNVSP
jgi:Trypsin